MKEQDYKYTNEFHSDFTTFPTVGVIVPKDHLHTFVLASGFVPNYSIFHTLHAQHKLVMVHDTIKTDVEYEHTS